MQRSSPQGRPEARIHFRRNSNFFKLARLTSQIDGLRDSVGGVIDILLYFSHAILGPRRTDVPNMYSAFCILSSVIFILCSIFCILYSILSILYSLFSIHYSLFFILYSVFCILYYVLCIRCAALLFARHPRPATNRRSQHASTLVSLVISVS